MAQNEWKETTRLITAAHEILADQNPMTVRQLFYRLVSVGGLIKNSRSHYTRISRVVSKARLDERIPFEWITDRSRPEYHRSVWEDAAGYLKTVSRSYRRDYWQDQKYHVELWCEKDAIIGSIQDVTDELGIRVTVGRGFQSTTFIHQIAERLTAKYFTEKKSLRIFYLGDHDPSGRAIEKDLAERVWDEMNRLNYDAFKNTAEEYPDLAKGEFPRITRLAIHPEDIVEFNLPPLIVKSSDSRAEGFIKQHGDDCVELDALPPAILRERIRNAVTRLLDMESWERALTVEAAEASSIRDFVAKLGQASV